MSGGITLARWSRLLVDEIFEDREGEGRPVSTIDAGEALLARALSRSNVQQSDQNALDAFLTAFPDRWQMLRWFSGVDNPGDALPAFLVLCCVAASETTGSEVNDYRERLREMMGWDAIIMDCAALPRLWRKLQAALDAAPAERRLRPLVLPDPRFRTQIGHAIELTFPSRQDGRRLKRDLEAGGLTDPNSPVAVMRWVGARARNYSPTFHETFADFQDAWRAGSRALTDHRFWSGWRVVVDTWRPNLTHDEFLVVSDVWGGHQLVTAAGEPTTLRDVEAAATGSLRQLLTGGSPILLREFDWGQYCWAGQGRAAAREARAALVREKSHSATVLALLDRHPVADAPGWFLTTAVDMVPGSAGRTSSTDDDLIDVRFHGVPRVDGGRLARPSFPLRMSATGGVGKVTLSGEEAGKLSLRRLSAQEWWITPTVPIEGEARIRIRASGDDIVRVVPLRRSTNAPAWPQSLPQRLVQDEVPSPPWLPTNASGEGETDFAFEMSHDAVAVQQGMADLVEFLTARPTSMPLGGFVDLLESLPGSQEVGKWALLRIVLEGGLVDPLRVRGWRGGAIVPRAPRAVLTSKGANARVIFDGLLNEVMISRIEGAARGLGLLTTARSGLGGWAPASLTAHGECEALMTLVSDSGMVCESITPDLAGHTRPSNTPPDANGVNHTVRTPIVSDEMAALAARGVEIFFCRREADDAAPVWLVRHADREPRYWAHRHLALLDACGIAGLPLGEIQAGALRLTIPGAYLPLQVARWLRLVTGTASGHLDGAHAYSITPGLEPVARTFLGLRIPIAPSSPLPERPRRGGGVARATPMAVDITPVWRWARDRSGVAR